MSTQLEIQPRELKFVVELNKQSKCTVKLNNKTDQHVAFKVKTTSPKRYCVRPNVGILPPEAAHEFIVIMQAPKTTPVDMTCKDKFLIQSTIVTAETLEDDITSEMFAKDSGRYVEESKLRVYLVNPPPPVSPDTLSINGTVKQVEDHREAKIENNEDIKPVKSAEVEATQDLQTKLTKNVTFESTKAVDSSIVKDVELNKKIEPITRKAEEVKEIEPRIPMNEEEQKIFKDIEEMKSKLHELESKLGKAEVTITKLTEERRLAVQDRDSLQQEMAFLKRRKVERRVQDGFPLLFVCMVALLSIVVGYGFHS